MGLAQYKFPTSRSEQHANHLGSHWKFGTLGTRVAPSTICRGDAGPWKLAAQWAQTAESIGAEWPLEKEPKWVRWRIGVRRLVRARNASNRRLKLTAILLETKPASLIQAPPGGFSTKTSSTKRRHFEGASVLGTDAERLARFISKRLRQSSHSNQWHRQTKQMAEWGNGKARTALLESCPNPSLQRLSAKGVVDSYWTRCMHCTYVQALEKLREKELRGSARKMADGLPRH